MYNLRYQETAGCDITLRTTPNGGALLRLIAGDLNDHSGPDLPEPSPPQHMVSGQAECGQARRWRRSSCSAFVRRPASRTSTGAPAPCPGSSRQPASVLAT